MNTERIIERMILDNYGMDDYDFIQDEKDDLKRTVSDGSLESEILSSVSDFVFNK
jgi:hypothetical protein